jgi:hypothetical protein
LERHQLSQNMNKIQIDANEYDHIGAHFRLEKNKEVHNKFVKMYNWIRDYEIDGKHTTEQYFLHNGVLISNQTTNLNDACTYAYQNCGGFVEWVIEVASPSIEDYEWKLVFSRNHRDYMGDGFFMRSYDCYIETKELTLALEMKLTNPWFD